MTLTFGIGGLLVAASVAVSASWFTLNFLTHQQERDALRQGYLNAAITRSQLQVAQPDVPQILGTLTSPSSSEAVIYSAGRWYSSSLLLSRDNLPAAIRDRALQGTVVWQWATVDSKREIVVGVPLRSVNSVYFQFFDQSALSRTKSVLTTVLIIAAAAVTLAGAAVGFVVSRRLTAPLRAVSEAARRVSAGDLTLQLSEQHNPELSQLITSFNAMVTTLATRIEHDARFAADVSHELRSPLTTLSTALSVLNTRRSELSPAGQEALALMTTETLRFTKLVDDLLEISRSDAPGDGDTEPVRLGELLLNLLERPQFHPVRANFGADALDAVVIGEKRRLEQLFTNILDNAAVHAGGATGVSMRCKPDSVVVEIDDDGPGVPVHDRGRVFERFARGEMAARGSRAGSGLGLALVREHVAFHGGAVWVTDAPNGGARYVVELPRAAL